MDDQDRPMSTDGRFAVEVQRLLDGRPDPGRNTHDPGNAPLDVLAIIAGQEQLDRIVG